MEKYISKEVQTEEIVPLRRKLNLNSSDLFSTPPSELRREISHLRGEISETHEFHDFELKILLEEQDIADSKNVITIAELEKSLKNAEDIILDTKKEISNLNTVIQDLQQQLKEESYKSSNLKEQYEHQISQLHLTLRKKSFEIENLEKDKNDNEFYVQLLRQNYERKIDELRLALEQNCEKNNGNDDKSFNLSERKLNLENDKAEELNEIRCTFEEEIKKLKDEHNDKLKSLELINANLKQTNESLTAELREANEEVEGLKQQLRILEDKTQSYPKQAIISKLNYSSGERCVDELEISGSRVVNLLSDKGKLDSIRKEFKGYPVSENKDSFHLVHKTVRYLGALCSQLEDSGSSLNLSNSSFDSFNEDLPSSTVMEDFTEVEISAVNDATVCNDPLAFTRDNTLQTPFKTPTTTNKNPSKTDFKTPFNSVSKPLRMPLRSPTGNVEKQFCPMTPSVSVRESNLNETELLKLKINLAMKEREVCEIKDMCMKNISHSEEVLTNMIKNISLLEERILKLENISADFKIEKEKLTTENFNIQEHLKKNIEEMTEIRRKLVVEITSLNPHIEGTLTDVDFSTLLNTFLNSIMESCKKMPEELSQKLISDIKALTEKTEMYEDKIFEREKEIDKLKEVNAELLSKKDEIEKQMSIRDDEIRTLHLKLCEFQSLRIKVKDLEERLEKSEDIIQTEIYLKESTLKDLHKLKKLFENVENDNHDLKLKLEQADKTIEDLRINLKRARKEHLCIVTKEELSELQGDEEELNTLESILEKYKKAEILIRNDLEACTSKLTEYETVLSAKTELIETITVELEESKMSKLKCDDIISELKEKLRNLEKENIALKSLESVLEEHRDKEMSLSEENENLNFKLKSIEVNLKEKAEFIAKLTTEIEEAKDIKIKDEKVISDLRMQIEELELQFKESKDIEKDLSEKVKDLSSRLAVSEVALKESLELVVETNLKLKETECVNAENLGLNLFTPRTFDMESRKIFDHVNNWMLKKLNEVRELKSQITELDEECESYTKKIKEDSQQMYKAWEEIRTLQLEKGKLEEEIKLLKCDLERIQAEDDPVRELGMERDWKKEMDNLKEENISLKSQIKTLNNELDQSKKQREELDEECESLAMAVKQGGEQRIKIWEEFQTKLKTLNDRIEKLEEEKNCLKAEKGDLLKEIKAKENGANNDCKDVKEDFTCNCRKQSKEVKELRSKIVVREMRILELEQLNEKNVVRKTQMKALENSLSAIKKKLAEENEVNQKLQAEIKKLSKQKGSQESEILEKLRIWDCGMAAVNQVEESEKLQKLEKDNRMLKELCRTRYNEIKRLETENLSLKGHERITKNSNQMDSPIRTRAYNRTLKNY